VARKTRKADPADGGALADGAERAAAVDTSAAPTAPKRSRKPRGGAPKREIVTHVEKSGGGEGEPEAVEVEADVVDEGADVESELGPDGAAGLDADADVDMSELPGVGDQESTSITRFDPMEAYLREVQRYPLLTPEQTHEIAAKFVETQDPKLAAQLVTANLRLVVKIAYEYRRAYKNIMDLVQEGNIGLMQAVKRYDPYRGVRLSSYAAWWIRAYILRFILNNWRLVKLGTTQAQRKLFFNLRKKRDELRQMGIEPTNEEIARRLNVPVSDVAEMDVRLAASEKSLDAPVGDAEGRSIAKVDMIPSAVEGPEVQMAEGELQALLQDKLAEFRKTLVGKEKELAIFDQRLVADDPLTLQELGDRFGISRERVRQLEQRLTSRLRDYLKQQIGDAAELVS
jgi:RNA polymerase sigma-32 factor